MFLIRYNFIDFSRKVIERAYEGKNLVSIETGYRKKINDIFISFFLHFVTRFIFQLMLPYKELYRGSRLLLNGEEKK
jgi:hypothetical protein